jgi:hypothetical protein
MPDWDFHRHSGTRASMHVHCPSPCCITKSVLRVHVHTACPCPCCMFMSMLHVNVHVHWHIIEMPECRTVQHPVSPVPDWKKLTMPKPVRYRTKLMQSSIFLVRYQTKIRDAGMPMPALVSLMPMPSYEFCLGHSLTPDAMVPVYCLYILARFSLFSCSGCCNPAVCQLQCLPLFYFLWVCPTYNSDDNDWPLRKQRGCASAEE